MCMGRTHVAMTGVLGLASVEPLVGHYLHQSMGIGQTLMFAGVTAGFGLLPDIDHPSSVLARSLGPATRAVAKIVGHVSGGHRKFTHTVWMAALMLVVVNLITTRYGHIGTWAFSFVGLYLAVLVLRLTPKRASAPGELLAALEAAGLTTLYQHYSSDWWWLPWAVAFGVIGHIAGDILTTEGVPIFYPAARRFVLRIPILGTTDHWREHLFAALLTPAAGYLILALCTGHPWYHPAWLANPSGWGLRA
jgi:membrane-bound metal-dependent hydrolase YbcI (DUF457 family)